MPEKTKPNKVFEEAEEEIVELPAEACEAVAKDTWSVDQQEKSYYYDDGYGYEIYNPDEAEEDEDED